MGYTHYWVRSEEIPQENWDAIIKCVKHLYKKLPKGLIQREWNDSKAPVANEKEIRFNGVDEDGHETFFVQRSDTGFNFCKTACKPYDLAVTAALSIIKHYAGDFVEVSSDGEAEEWAESNDLVKKLFGFDGAVR